MANPARNRRLIANAWRRVYDPTKPAMTDAEARAALDDRLLDARAAENAAPKPPPASRVRFFDPATGEPLRRAGDTIAEP